MDTPFDQFQRAVFYSDVLFETVRIANGQIPLLEGHFERLTNDMNLLGMTAPPEWSLDFFKKALLHNAPEHARARCTVFRSPGGLYFPQNNAAQWIVQHVALPTAYPEWPEKALRIGVAQRVRLPMDDFSGVKTLNAARYVQAAREAHAQGWDDALLLNGHERIAEATSSNVFWWKNDQLYTVPLAEGGVAGVMRAFIMHHFSVVEHPVIPEELRRADEIFLTNAIRWVVPVGQWEARIFEQHRSEEVLREVLGVVEKEGEAGF
jgi:branched-chain amino acid aminotransferase